MTDSNPTSVTRLQKKINRLQTENCILKRLLDDAGIAYASELVLLDVEGEREPYDPEQGGRITTPQKYTRQMADIFLDYFWGRRDVYAKRYVGKKSGFPGYYPQCANTWKPQCPRKQGVKQRCLDCGARQFLHLTYDDLYRHFRGDDPNGNDVLGTYAMLPDSTCRFLVFDFDNHENKKDDFANTDNEWIEEVDAMRAICELNGIDPLVERSRSGKGAHIWIFFEEPVKASLARRFGEALLDRGAERVNLKSFRYYDRMMPTQDSLNEGGIGNLIALPLQGLALKVGNSAFIDRSWNAYPNQWEVFANKPKVSASFIEAKITEWTGRQPCCGEGITGKPWDNNRSISKKDAPDGIRVTLSNGIYISKEGISAPTLNGIRRLAAFRDSMYFKKRAMGLSTLGKGSWVYLGEDIEEDGYLRIPQGLLDGLKNKCDDDVELSIDDLRCAGESINVSFKGTLKSEQERALAEMMRHENGILQAATAFGKTVLSCAMIAKRGISTLILVEKTDLLDQWTEAIQKFLEINEELPKYMTKSGRTYKRKSLVGRLKAAHDSLTGIIDIAMVGSVIKKGMPHEKLSKYGMVIADECHHMASETALEVMSCVKSKYVYGITATPERADGMEKAVYMVMGPIRYKYTALDQAQNDKMDRFVRTRFTRAVVERGKNEKLSSNEAYEILRNNEQRDKQIVEDVVTCVENGRTPVILSRFKDHSERLYTLLKNCADNVFLVMGNGTRENRDIVDRMKNVNGNESLILVATGKKLGEGFDFPRLDTLMMAEPVSFKSVLEQFVGRLGRAYPGKKDIIVYDYVDRNIPMFDVMFTKRLKAYKKIGYKVADDLKPSSNKENNAIFDFETYREPFWRDLNFASKSITISSPAISGPKVEKMCRNIREIQKAGVRITVITLAPDSVGYGDAGYWMKLHEDMRQAGITVLLTKDFCQHYAIIDDKIVWYGSMNFLSKEDADDNLIREEDPVVVEDLKSLTFSEGTDIEKL